MWGKRCGLRREHGDGHEHEIKRGHVTVHQGEVWSARRSDDIGYSRVHEGMQDEGGGERAYSSQGRMIDIPR